MKYIPFILIAFILSATNITKAVTLNKEINDVKTVKLEKANKSLNLVSDSIAPDSSEMSSLNSVDFAKKFGRGWNIGNSLEATGGETSWGNPKITQTLIDSVKAAGFNSVRIPVAWSKFTDTSTYKIDSTWMARIEQVVNYVLKDSMYAIINEHWDGGWMQPTYARQAYVNKRFSIMWHQIAVHFRDYNDHLLFAGTNEVMVNGDYSTPTKEYYTVQNGFNQIFVNTVRSTGGRNVYRYLLAQGFNTNIGYTVSYFTIPKDVITNRLIVEVHYYDPYDFTINSGSSIIEWGNKSPDASKVETWANESYADGQFQLMETNFINKKYAVIVGEYGAQARLNLGSNALDSIHTIYRRYYMKYITHSIVGHGLIPFYWDSGSTGDNAMGLFNRSTGSQAYPDIIDAIIDTSNVKSPVNINTTNAGILKIYPNPTNGIINIEVKGQHINYTQLYDSVGNIIQNLNLKNGANSFNIDYLKPGVYLVYISTSEGYMVHKIIKD